MFKVLYAKKEVTEFKNSNGIVIYKNNNSLRNKSLYVDNQRVSEEGVTGFSIFNNVVYFSTWNNGTYSFCLESHQTQKIDYGQIIDLFFDNGLVFGIGNDKFCLIEPSKNEIFKCFPSDLPTNKALVFKKGIYSANDNLISFFERDEFTWQFDISEIGEFISPIGNKPAEVEQLIGVYGQILWVYLGNGKLIGLDAQTGKLVHELNDTPENNIHGGTMRPLADGGKRERFIHYYLDQSAGKLIGLSFNTYCEVDLKQDSPSFEFWNIKEQMPSWGIKEFARNIAWDGHNSLFFFDANAHLWGVFDITQRQIVWVSDPISIPCKADSFTQLREIQYGAGKVYVLDSAQTLHVFEKVE
jgi:hypothetical protein